jgi:hypothetical protein
MKRIRLWSLAIAIATATTFLATSNLHAQDANAAGVKPVPPSIKKRLIDDVIPALNNHDLWTLYNEFTPILQKASPETLPVIEAYIDTQSQYSIKDKYAEAKMMRIEQGVDAIGGQGTTPAVAMFTVEGISDRIQEFMDRVIEHPMMKEPDQMSDDWRMNRQVFWDAHVFKNEFTNKGRLVDFALSLLNSQRTLIANRGRPSELKTIDRIDELAGQLPLLEKQLVEMEAKLRLDRFNLSHELMKQIAPFEDRFVAAICLELDGDVLLTLLDNPPRNGFDLDELNNPNLRLEINEKLSELRSSKDEIAKKASLLRSGMHSWFRGRYGFGPMGEGLLKAPEAMDSVQQMVGLFMPGERPLPISAYHPKLETSPGYERRHFYTWAVEYRPLSSSMKVNNDVTKTTLASNPVSTGCDYFW